MSTYSLSGSGTHALTANTTGLQVSITTPSAIGGLGRSNPVARYDQGLIRFSDGTAYWAPVPVLGGPHFIPVPANATSFGYAMLAGAVVSVVEVIGGTVFFSGGATALSGLSDVTIASLSNGQILEWVAADSRWENVTPVAVTQSYQNIASVVVAGSAVATIDFSGIPGTFSALLIIGRARATGANNFELLNYRFNADAGNNYDQLGWDSGGGVSNNAGQNHAWAGLIVGGGGTANYAGSIHIEIPAYASATWFKNGSSLESSQNGTPRVGLFASTWKSTAPITQVTLSLGNNSFAIGTSVSLYGML